MRFFKNAADDDKILMGISARCFAYRRRDALVIVVVMLWYHRRDALVSSS